MGKLPRSERISSKKVQDPTKKNQIMPHVLHLHKSPSSLSKNRSKHAKTPSLTQTERRLGKSVANYLRKMGG